MTKSVASRVNNHVKTNNCFVTPCDGWGDVVMTLYDNAAMSQPSTVERRTRGWKLVHDSIGRRSWSIQSMASDGPPCCVHTPCKALCWVSTMRAVGGAAACATDGVPLALKGIVHTILHP